MDFAGTHITQRILEATEPALAAVPRADRVTASMPYGPHPRTGTLIDIALVEEDDEKLGGMNARTGSYRRVLQLGIVAKANLNEMTAIEFEGFAGDIERAMASITELDDLVDDIQLVKCEWKYGQDTYAAEVAKMLIYAVIYKTPANNPGV